MLARIADLLAPAACLACGAPGRDLCGDCRRALVPLRGPCCPRCALPAPCGPPCPARGSAIAVSWAAVAYADVARSVVLAAKRGRARPAVGVMAPQILAAAPDRVLARERRSRRAPADPPGVVAPAGPPPGALVVVPVPTTPDRRAARGYDQAERLARAVGGRAGLGVRRLLRRDGAAHQTGASRSARLAAGRVAFTLAGEAPARVLLVDDVRTTGATLESAARALRAAGAREVLAATWARTL